MELSKDGLFPQGVMKMLMTILITAALSTMLTPGRVLTGCTRRPDIVYMEQPEGIPMGELVGRWPELASDLCGAAIDTITVARVSRLRHRTEQSGVPSELNLLAQLEREVGALSASLATIDRAIAVDPDEYLHHWQRAMTCHALLRAASPGMSRWRWHNETADSYERAFELNDECVPCRYYLAYAAQQTPAAFGGDPDYALSLALEGVAIGQRGFTVVVADLCRLQADSLTAVTYFDAAVAEGAFKINAFVSAVALAIKLGDHERAARYAAFLVACRPDSPRSYIALGDAATFNGDAEKARNAYETAGRIGASEGVQVGR